MRVHVCIDQELADVRTSGLVRVWRCFAEEAAGDPELDLTIHAVGPVQRTVAGRRLRRYLRSAVAHRVGRRDGAIRIVKHAVRPLPIAQVSVRLDLHGHRIEFAHGRAECRIRGTVSAEDPLHERAAYDERDRNEKARKETRFHRAGARRPTGLLKRSPRGLKLPVAIENNIA